MGSFKSIFTIEGIDKISAPFRSIAKQTELARDVFKKTSVDLSDLQKKLKTTEAYDKAESESKELETQLKAQGTALSELKNKIIDHKSITRDLCAEYAKEAQILKNLARRIDETTNPSKTLTTEYNEQAIKLKYLNAEIKESERATKRTKAEYTATDNQIIRLKTSQENLTVRLSKLSDSMVKHGIETKNVSETKSKLIAEEEKLTETLKNQEKALDHLNATQKKRQAIDKARDQKERSAQAMATVGSASSSLGLGIFRRSMTPVNVAMDFEAAMSKVQAKGLTDLSKDEQKSEMARLRGLAIKLGAKTSFSASQVAGAQENLAMAGVSSSEMTEEVLTGLLNVAGAGGLSVEKATEVATTAIRGLGMEMSKIGEVGDILAFAANTSNTDILEMGEVFKKVGPVAKMFKVDLKQVSSMVGILSNVGIKGEVAGTTIKNMLLNFSAPSSEARDALKSLKVETKDASGNLRPFSLILRDVALATEKMGNTRKAAYFKVIAGMEAVAGFSELAELAKTQDGFKKLTEIENSMEKVSGTAAKMAAIMKDNLKGDVDELSGSLESLHISLGSLLTPSLRTLATGFSEVVSKLSLWSQEHPRAAKALVGLSVAIGGMLVVGGSLMVMLAALRFSFSQVSWAVQIFGLKGEGVFKKLGAGILLLTRKVVVGIWAMTAGMSATGIGAVIVGLGVAAGLLIYNWDSVKSFFLSFWDKITPVWKSFADFVSSFIPLFSSVGEAFSQLFGGGDIKGKVLPPSIFSALNTEPLMSVGSPGPFRFDPTVNITMQSNASPEDVGLVVRRELKKAGEDAQREARSRSFHSGALR